MLRTIYRGYEVIKKRVVISIILTALAIWGSHNYWLDVKPINVTFDAQGKNIQNIEVQLSKYDSPEFKKFKAQKKNVKLDKKQKLSFEFKKPFAPKRLKLVLVAKSAQGGGVSLSNITLRDKIHLNDLENFSADNATLKIKDNKLFITPHDKNFSITYNKILNVRASIKLDILVLLIIAIITYLVAFKFTSYLADFKINKEKSRIDIVFLAIFFLIMFIPMMRISNEKISPRENRTLANYKPLFTTKGLLNYNYGKDFDKWFSDRFNQRKMLMNLHDRINYRLCGEIYEVSNAIFNKKNNWMFLKSTSTQITYNHKDAEKDAKVISLLSEFNKFLANNNIKLYVLIVPAASDIYFNENIFPIKNYVEEDKLFAQKLRDNHVRTIYPYDALKEASKNDFTYFKTDWHWTEYGAYIGFSELAKEIQKDFPDFTPVTLDDYTTYKSKMIKSDWKEDFHNGGIMRYIHPPKNDISKILDTEYTYYTHKQKSLLKKDVIDIPKRKSKVFSFAGKKYKAIFMGTSMNENLMTFAPYNFKETEYIRLIHVKDQKVSEHFKIMKLHRKKLLNEKPDILVLCITVLNLFNSEEIPKIMEVK